jgi:hypothetical protein
MRKDGTCGSSLLAMGGLERRLVPARRRFAMVLLMLPAVVGDSAIDLGFEYALTQV